MIGLGAGFGALNIGLGRLVGPRRPTPEKLAPYECGMPPVGDARDRHPVKFYLVAMIFLLFDIEIAFLYPWALAVRELRMTPAEALWAATAGGARALRADDLGRLSPGARADVAVLDAPSYRHLAYRPGVPIARALDLPPD